MNKAMSVMPESLKFILICLYSAFAGVLILFLTALLSAFLLTFAENPEGFYTLCVICAKVICGFFAGRIAIRKNRRYALLCGATASVFIMGILFLISVFVPENAVQGTWWQILLIPLCTVAGAVISNKE